MLGLWGYSNEEGSQEPGLQGDDGLVRGIETIYK